MKKQIYEEFWAANVIGVTLQHNGLQGGDAGHGGYVRITIKNLGSTCMEVNDEFCDEFELCFRGDSERQTLISALKMIVQELESTHYNYLPF